MSQAGAYSPSNFPGGFVQTLTGNTGGPVPPVAGNINIVTANSTFLFTGAGNTLTLDFFQANSNIGSNLPAITVGTRNTGYGAGVNQSLTSGNDNTTVGYGAFVNATTASQNIAIGSQALNANVVADDNVAIGFQALTLSTGGFENVAIGTRSMANLTSGDSNTAVGYLSLFNNATGLNNVAIGSGALGNATNNLNIGLGFQSGINATTNSSCIYIGNSGVAAENNTIRLGTYNAAPGAGQQNKCFIAAAYSNFGTQNTFVGEQAGNTTLTVGSAISNIAVGFQSLDALTTGAANVAVGESSGGAITTGSNNTALGNEALEVATTGNENTAVGSSALGLLTTASFNTAVGSSALSDVTTGIANIGLGINAGTSYTSENSNIAIGHIGVVGDSNMQRLGTDGPGLGQIMTTIIAGDVSSVRSFTAISGDITATLGDIVATAGNFVLPVTTAAVGQIAQAGQRLLHTYNVSNLFLGYQAGNFTTTGQNNTGLGYETLFSLGVAGNSNTAVGFHSARGLTTGSANVSVGEQALNLATTASYNTSLGYASLGNAALTSGSYNTCIGAFAGQNLTTSDSSNILIGRGVTATAGNNNRLQIGSATGAGIGELNTAFIHGIYNITPASATTEMVIIDNNGQLGSTSLSPSTLFPWSVITLDQTAAVNNGYFCNKAGTLVLALPAASAVGDMIEVANINTATGIQITQAAGQQIFIGNTNTTLGAGGSLTSTAVGDTLKLVCRTANTTYQVVSMIGNWTVV